MSGSARLSHGVCPSVSMSLCVNKTGNYPFCRKSYAFFLKRQKEILSFLLNVWEIFYIFATENKSQTMTLGKAHCNLIQYLYL